MTAPHSEQKDIGRDILELAAQDAAVRARAARSIFNRARALIETTVQNWISQPELGVLLSSRGKPELPCLAVGVAVFPATFEAIHRACGSPRLADVPPDQDAREFELHFAAGIVLDILTTRAPGSDGAIARFLEKFGEGIQQIELQTTDVDQATQLLREKFGLAPIYPATRAGAGGTRVNFFLVPAADGRKALIELVEE